MPSPRPSQLLALLSRLPQRPSTSAALVPRYAWLANRASFSTTFAPRLATTSSTSLEPPVSTAVPLSAETVEVVGSSEVVTPAPQWLPGMRRTGVVARKKGMTGLWDSNGTRIPVTILELQDTQVVGHKRPPSDNYYAVQVGCSDRHTGNHLHHSERSWFRANGVNPKHEVVEFQVDGEDGLVPIGTYLSSAHFVPGQYVDAKGTSKGKGFAGVMKRWDFGGGNASHGATKDHRSAGSTGQHQDPGRVWPGKKMAGRMGHDPITIRNLLIARIDTVANVIYVKGQVPGPNKGFVKLWDAEDKVRRLSEKYEKKGWGKEEGLMLPGVKSLPFPCGDKDLAEQLPREITYRPAPKKAGT